VIEQTHQQRLARQLELVPSSLRNTGEQWATVMRNGLAELGQEIHEGGQRGPGSLVLAAGDLLGRTIGEHQAVGSYLIPQVEALLKEALRWLGDNGD
jgi:hypothetical protein